MDSHYGGTFYGFLADTSQAAFLSRGQVKDKPHFPCEIVLGFRDLKTYEDVKKKKDLVLYLKFGAFLGQAPRTPKRAWLPVVYINPVI